MSDATEAVEEVKPRAARRPKKKKISPKIYKFYQLKEGKLIRIKRECPRCGRGVFMAQHRDRYYCGKCGYTEWVAKSKGR